MKYCPLCTTEMVEKIIGEAARLACASEGCDFIHWDNPTPVVAVVVEHQGKIVLANNYAWPDHIYSVITGFLEKKESAAEGAIREVKEELGLTSVYSELIDIYPFARMNQIIMGYYVRARGSIELNEELRSYKHVEKEDLFTWDSATGYILRDWLNSQGLQAEEKSLFKALNNQKKRSELYQRIDELVCQIPEGQLATYGQIAKLLGKCGARQVGYAMSSLQEDSEVPWQRVINSQGQISSRNSSDGHTLQRIILEEEGIEFNEKGKVNLEKYRWQGPGNDSVD